jgi:8-oxo-dGTP diphosphatase
MVGAAIEAGRLSVDVVDEWDGRLACALQDAMRMTGEEFAARLGIAVRTVRDWHSRPEMKPRQLHQQSLDVLLEQAPEHAKVRFRRSLRAIAEVPATEPRHDGAMQSAAAVALTVSVAIVMTASDVLIVCRRDDEGSGITWQFPAGVVKPGGDPATVAVRETLAETGVHCSISEQLGSRLHPVTGVFCHYFQCDYLAGDVENRDVVENASVMWVRRDAIARFIPEDRIYPPVLRKLLEDHEAAAS